MRGRVIRGQANTVPGRKPNPERARVLRFRQVEASRAAEAVVAEATRQAEQMIGQAREQAARLLEETAAQAERERALQLLKLEQRAADLLQQQVDQLRGDVARLAIAVAERVLDRQLERAPEWVPGIVAQVLRGVCPARRALVRAHPADVPHLERELDQLRRAAEASELTIEGDASIDRGGCVVETPLVQVDGRLSIQLEELARAVEEQLRERGTDLGEVEP